MFIIEDCKKINPTVQMPHESYLLNSEASRVNVRVSGVCCQYEWHVRMRCLVELSALKWFDNRLEIIRCEMILQSFGSISNNS